MLNLTINLALANGIFIRCDATEALNVLWNWVCSPAFCLEKNMAQGRSGLTNLAELQQTYGTGVNKK
jgi:hypothetical protein